MHKMARKRVLHIWLALLAVLFAALAPSISHALAAHSSSETPSVLLQICTVAGLKTAPAGDAERQPSIDPVVHAFEHCPYCFTHAGSFALLSTSDLSLSIPSARAVFPPLFYRAPRTLFVWSSGNPRGPPLTV
ncbi:DUF2946 domain-containing protein [Janthinobacterium sp. DSP2-3-3]|uniref:DUF2946 domain-containing protein n=1 Tax=Janthinobacterium sp. DSP2-3-3 TaxID=2804596 RepID=UPI003CF8562E